MPFLGTASAEAAVGLKGGDAPTLHRDLARRETSGMDFLFRAFLPMLIGWSVLWLGGSFIGLWTTTRRSCWNSFWFMSGLWSTVNVAIAGIALLDPPAAADEFRSLLLINAGLDVGYLAIGGVLLSRPRPMLTGFGLAIIVQGAFLLVLDLAWWAWLGAR